MGASAEYTEYVLEKLALADHVDTRKFFGGVGLLYGATQFAVIMENTLYFVVNETTRKKYEKLGMRPFSYATKKGVVQVKRFYELPEDVLDDPGVLRKWMREAILVSQTVATKSKAAA